MILPKDIKTRHKIRDSKILALYASGELPQALIAERFHISQSRVNQILKANASLVLNMKDFEKLQRLSLIKRDTTKSSIPLAKKDLIELWRKEFEGEAPINIITQFLQLENPSEVKNRLTQSA